MDRGDLRRKGAAMRERLGQGEPAGETAPGYRELIDELLYGTVWSRPGLSIEDRMATSLAALCAVQRLDHLRRHVRGALDLGVEPRAIAEIFIQCGIYAGFPVTDAALDVAGEVFAGRGIALPRNTGTEASLDELMSQGRTLLQELHGSRGNEGYASPDNKVTGTLYPVAIQYGYGAIWHRPGLDRRRRALVAVAAFTALRLEGQVRKFGQSALNAGMSRDEVIETVIQTGPYSGLAPALNALAALSDVLR